ncbi:MAG: sterol desaturase family protein, partial [Eudoraea sp.]
MFIEFLETLFNELIGFLGIAQVLELVQAGNYEAFRTYDGIVSLIYPIIPLLVILELILGLIYKNPQTKVYKVNFLIYIFNRFVGRFIAIAMVAFCIGLFQHLAPFQTSFTWYWFIY